LYRSTRRLTGDRSQPDFNPPGPWDAFEQSDRLAAADDAQTALQGVFANALLFDHFGFLNALANSRLERIPVML
jgi:hypothetical protein